MHNKAKNRLVKSTSIFIAISIAILTTACINNRPVATTRSSANTAFPVGEKVNNSNFTGTVWLQMLVSNDSTYNTSIGNVTFEPKARTNWHKHPGGQILLVTDGEGYYQVKGKPIQLIKKGDTVKIQPDTEHWHGASPNCSMTHIAISPNTNKGSVVWLQPVTDEEYEQSLN